MQARPQSAARGQALRPGALALARRAAPPALASLVIALVAVAVFGTAAVTYISNDPLYAVIWGHDLATGHLPDYGGAFTSTPHPLLTVLGAFASLFGGAGTEVMRGMILLSTGALVVGVFRLGREAYAWPVGLVAALVLATREPFANFGPLWGYQDMLFAALVVWAVVVEARQPRRGVPVLVLLALAGLLRPEAWVLAGGYWLWLAPRLDWSRRVGFAALVVAPPVVWVLTDLIVTGDPFWSFHDVKALTTPSAADPTDPEKHFGEDLPWPFEDAQGIVRSLGGFLGKPEAVVAVAGLAAGLVFLRRRSYLPAIVAVAVSATSLVLAGFGLPALTRFILPACAMLALFVGVAAMGWSVLEGGHPARRGWRVAGLGALVLLAAIFPLRVSYVGDLKGELDDRYRAQEDLRDLVRTPRAEAALAGCPRIYVADPLPAPSLAYWADRRPGDIRSTRERTALGEGLVVVPATQQVLDLAGRDMSWPELQRQVPADYRLVAKNRSWRLFTGCRASG